MKLMRPWIGIALLAPMLVLAVSASSFWGLRCRMTGMVSLSTCCPESDDAPAPAQSSVDQPGCCERLQVETAKPVADRAATGEGAPPLSPAMVPVADTTLSPPVSRPITDRDPLRLFRPPLRLLKRSLLI
jgi:hypothetical protein